MSNNDNKNVPYLLKIEASVMRKECLNVYSCDLRTSIMYIPISDIEMILPQNDGYWRILIYDDEKYFVISPEEFNRIINYITVNP